MVNNQDGMAWITQGTIARRELERLGESDRGLIFFRRLLQEQMKVVEDGGDPLGTYRNPEVANRIMLPLETEGVGGISLQRLKYRPAFWPKEGSVGPAYEKVEQIYDTWREFTASGRAIGDKV